MVVRVIKGLLNNIVRFFILRTLKLDGTIRIMELLLQGTKVPGNFASGSG